MTDFKTIHVGPFTYTKRPYYRGDGHDWHREHNGHRNIASAESSTLVDAIESLEEQVAGLKEDLELHHKDNRQFFPISGCNVEGCSSESLISKNKRSELLAALGEGE